MTFTTDRKIQICLALVAVIAAAGLVWQDSVIRLLEQKCDLYAKILEDASPRPLVIWRGAVNGEGQGCYQFATNQWTLMPEVKSAGDCVRILFGAENGRGTR